MPGHRRRRTQPVAVRPRNSRRRRCGRERGAFGADAGDAARRARARVARRASRADAARPRRPDAAGARRRGPRDSDFRDWSPRLQRAGCAEAAEVTDKLNRRTRILLGTLAAQRRRRGDALFTLRRRRRAPTAGERALVPHAEAATAGRLGSALRTIRGCAGLQPDAGGSALPVHGLDKVDTWPCYVRAGDRGSPGSSPRERHPGRCAAGLDALGADRGDCSALTPTRRRSCDALAMPGDRTCVLGTRVGVAVRWRPCPSGSSGSGPAERGRPLGMSGRGRPDPGARRPIACGRARSRSSSARPTCSRPASRCTQAIADGQLHSTDSLGTAGHRQDHARAPDRRSLRRAVHRALGGAGRHQGHPRRGRAGASRRAADGRPTVLFLDEVHRFNKAQQDAFLPHVEDGTLTFIGATTENPVVRDRRRAAVARARVRAQGLSVDGARRRCSSARWPTASAASAARIWRSRLRRWSCSRRRPTAMRAGRLGMLELAAASPRRAAASVITLAQAQEVASGGRRRFDKGGEQFYDQISALHKAVRGTDPGRRALLARAHARWRLRSASTSRGASCAWPPRTSASPIRARCTLALEAWQVYERLGSPEGELAIAQAVVYLAVRRQEQCGLHRLRRGARGRRALRHRSRCRCSCAMRRRA